MAIVGSDGGDNLGELLSDRLRTGRWPEEERQLLALEQRMTLLNELASEAFGRWMAYRAKAAVITGLRQVRYGEWVLPRARGAAKKKSRSRSPRTKS